MRSAQRHRVICSQHNVARALLDGTAACEERSEGVLAVVFDYINGFHDPANAIATSVAGCLRHLPESALGTVQP